MSVEEQRQKFVKYAFWGMGIAVAALVVYLAVRAIF